MSTQITLQQLAKKLGGNYWEKGDLKRIYLDEGYNTKKMSTKTFVWENEEGEFIVSCKVECPSQPWEWCKSQEEEVKERVYLSIQNALSDTVFIVVNKEGVPCNYKGDETTLNNSTYFFTEKEAIAELDNCHLYDHYITMPRDEFEAEEKRLDEEQRPERERLAAEAQEKRDAELAAKRKADKIASGGIVPGKGMKVKHVQFGIGEVIADDGKIIEVLFASGVKKMVKKYTKLEQA